MADARHPVFDRGGKLLFFSASTNLGPSFSFAELSGLRAPLLAQRLRPRAGEGHTVPARPRE
ncbi:MAG: hypothetical protein AB2L07_19095 [Thermoanaerobaculaceae bacterium]